MGGPRRPRSPSRRGRDRSRGRGEWGRRGRERERSAAFRSRERRAKEKIAQLEAKLRHHNQARREGQRLTAQEVEEGWQVSGGGKAGRRARRRAAARGRREQQALAEQPAKKGEKDDLRFPEWMCLMCQEFQWATRLECRFCHAPRRMEPSGGGARARAEERPLELAAETPAATFTTTTHGRSMTVNIRALLGSDDWT